MKKSLFAAFAVIGVSMISAQAALAHGNHRNCEEGRYGWHRHVGKHGQHRIACERPYRSYRQRCETICKRVGPFQIKSCRTVCH